MYRFNLSEYLYAILIYYYRHDLVLVITTVRRFGSSMSVFVLHVCWVLAWCLLLAGGGVTALCSDREWNERMRCCQILPWTLTVIRLTALLAAWQNLPKESFRNSQHISEEVCNLSVKILRFDSLFICQQPEFSSTVSLIVLTLLKLYERILLIPIIFPFSCKSIWVVSIRTI
jgi:hypothetical protein